MLGVEQLEARDVPATLWADVAGSWEPGTFDRWVAGGSGGVDWSVSRVHLDGTPRVVLYANDGGGARVVVVNPEGTAAEIDRTFFDPEKWRAGVGEVESIGSTLYVTPGVGAEQLPGPVYGKIKLDTGEVSYHAIPGFDPNWRGGAKIAVADVDWVPGLPGGNSADPEKELVFLPGGTPEIVPGNVFFIVNSGDDSLHAAVAFGDPDQRQRWEFGPAMIDLSFPDDTTGFALQPLGSVVTDGRVGETILVRWDGVVVDFPRVTTGR